MSGFTWSAVENALSVWALAATGLPIVKGGQEGPRPTTGPHVVMTLLDVAPSGVDWVDAEEVEDPEPGAEIAHIARGMRVATLRVECFAGGGDAALPSKGSTSPLAKLERMIGMAAMPTRLDALEAAGVGLLSIGVAQSIPGVLVASFEPRAMFEVRVSLASELTELGTYIQATEVGHLDDEGDLVGDLVVVGDLPVLVAPTDLVAEAGDGTITLTWTAARGADGYRVYRGEAPGVTDGSTLAGSPSGPPFVDTGRNNGTEYFYVVVSTSTVVDPSDESDEVSATPSA